MKKAINMQELNNKMLWMGFRDNLQGTAMLREAVQLWELGMPITKELYPMIAKKFGSTPSRVERCMRHAIESAWDRGDLRTIDSVFCGTVSARRGLPTVSEFVSRMAVYCAIED